MNHRKSNNIFSLHALIYLLALSVVLWAPLLAPAQTGVSREYNIKAVFLYNFTRFAEWPDDAFKSPSEDFIIGIAGNDPFGGVLDQTVAGEKVNGHPIVIQRYASADDVQKCQILFISATQKEDVQQIIKSLDGSSTLTVGDMPDFVREGGMIGFKLEDNKIKLQINLAVVKSSQITISSKLLRLAEIVGQ